MAENEIELISDGDGLAVIGQATDVERFLTSEGMTSTELDLPRLSEVFGGGAAAAEVGSYLATNSGRWVKLTAESADRVKKYGLMPAKTKGLGVAHAMIGDPGSIEKWLQIEKFATNPALLSGIGGLMAQAAMQQAMDQILDYLETIDAKVDDVLRAQKDSVLADMIGVDFVLEEAMTLRAHLGRVNEVTWSKVQGTSLAIARTQAYALRQLDALAEKVERTAAIGDLAKIAKESRTTVQEWLAVLARCFQLQDGAAVLELDRVLDSAPDELDGHRLALKAAREDRLALIARSTERLLTRVAEAADLANAKVLLNPIDSPAIVGASNHVGVAVIEFRGRLGIDRDREALVARRWREAAEEAKDKALDVGADGVDAAKRFGTGTLDRAESLKDGLFGKLAALGGAVAATTSTRPESVASRKKEQSTPVDAITHEDGRANIPTPELESFAPAGSLEPSTLLYDRDPTLDPQLVWRGKDAQDGSPLEVLAPPIYLQEKIEPRVIIENLRRTAAQPEDEPELRLFESYDADLSFDEKIGFYQHADRWKNRLILGDSLAVMASLAEKEDLKGKVQTIYMDPPYGIKFGSNWQVSTRKRDVKDGSADDVTRQPEQIKAYRDTWELGIHSYLTYLRDRFTVARDLLTDSGSIFVQIGDENVHLVRAVLDEVFGSENFVSQAPYKTTSGAGSFAVGTTALAGVVDYLVWYARDRNSLKYRQLYSEKELGGAGGGQYSWVERTSGERAKLKAGEAPSPGESIFSVDNLTSQTTRLGQTTVFPVDVDEVEYVPGRGGWKTNRAGMSRLHLARRLIGVGRTLRYVRFIDDFPVFPINNLWDDTVTSGFGDAKVYAVQTNTKVIQRCMLMTTDPGDLVLDPTCGSGTTAVGAEQWGRRWITCDTSRVALALARTRIMSAKFPGYLLADTKEGAIKEAEQTGTAPATGPFRGDIRRGFAYRRVPHITLKSIAQNPDIEEEMSREDIDAAIRRHADLETLYDQPFEDKKRVRVAGPFTVESLSPHRAIPIDGAGGSAEPSPRSEREAERSPGSNNYEQTIIENLRTAGVQNTVRDERLEFETLSAHAGRWVQAMGSYRLEDGSSQRVGVVIGPEHGTVGSRLVREGAKEAMRGAGVDLLLVCGFAFDATSPETAAELNGDDEAWATSAGEQTLGSLAVQLVKMNPDLAMGDELLKKTGAGNLFMVFGEPDVEIRTADGQVVVELHGLDVYDPTTGVVRTHSTDDIACWFVDTDYDSESFFVRHAYFTGADKPYERLSKALKADIDPDVWETLYRTESRPFDRPSTGRIAVKVINHYGDEVLKVYEVPGA